MSSLPAWQELKEAVVQLRLHQTPDGSISASSLAGNLQEIRDLTAGIQTNLLLLATAFPHDADYLTACSADFGRWAEEGFGVPDFFDSLVAFHPEKYRINGLQHVVVFPMYTQNGSSERLFEAVLIEVIWPDFVAELEATDYSNKLFVPIRFLDFTEGYNTHSAVLFPETVAMRAVPTFTWGAIFADREAARFRKVLTAAAEITRLELPLAALELVESQELTEETFVMWDLIHDRTHMRGDLPFDPFMIKQRMPFFLYTLEELRCDLTAFREAVKIEQQAGKTGEHVPSPQAVETAKRMQYAIIFDRIFRFALSGTRVRNYDGLGGQLLFAWLHQRRVLHWSDTTLTFDWPAVAEAVTALGSAIDELYWRSIDRPKIAHWLAAYAMISETLTPHPASLWAQGPRALPLTGSPGELTNTVLDDEFPLSMFYEALQKKMATIIESTQGITGKTA